MAKKNKNNNTKMQKQAFAAASTSKQLVTTRDEMLFDRQRRAEYVVVRGTNRIPLTNQGVGYEVVTHAVHPLNEQLFSDELQDWAKYYDKYLCTRLDIQWASNLAADEKADIGIMYDVDARDGPPIDMKTLQRTQDARTFTARQLGDGKHPYKVMSVSTHGKLHRDELMFVSPDMGADPMFMHQGRLNIATEAATNYGTLGYLLLEYSFRLYFKTAKPPLPLAHKVVKGEFASSGTALSSATDYVLGDSTLPFSQVLNDVNFQVPADGGFVSNRKGVGYLTSYLRFTATTVGTLLFSYYANGALINTSAKNVPIGSETIHSSSAFEKIASDAAIQVVIRWTGAAVLTVVQAIQEVIYE
jgi:hypothetical protein